MLENIDKINKAFGHTCDLKIRYLETNKIPQSCIIYIDGLINSERLEEFVIAPLVQNINTKIKISDLIQTKNIDQVIKEISQGKAAVLFNNSDSITIVDVTLWKERPVAESLSERNPKGLLIGLTEKAKTNISIIRSILKTPSLTVETIQKGTVTPTDIYILYMRDIAQNEILQEVKNRLNDLDVKYVLQAQIVEEVLAQNNMTLFPLTSFTEVPDVVASAILEGKIVIFVDNTPYAIICPALFIEFFQSPEEYYSKYGRLLNRFLKFLSFLVAIYSPAFFILLQGSEVLPKNVHKILYPNDILISPFFEVIVLMLILKLLLDGIYKIHIHLVVFFALISTILIGENLLKIKMISPFCLIVLCMTFATSLIFSNRGLFIAIPTLRFIYFIASYLFGIWSLIIISVIVFIHVVMLKSINTPYLSPIIPFNPKEFRDVFFRSNLKRLINSKHSYPKK